MFYNRTLFTELQKRLAQSYGVKDVVEMFDVTPPMAVKLLNAVMESDEFLRRCSLIPVTDSKGELVTMTVPSTIAGRTDTSSTGERAPQRIGAPTGRYYDCKQTNYDVALQYALVDAWARFADFDQRLMGAIYKRQGLDRLLIGWYGTSAAATTNRTSNPLLQDVNQGWIYDLKTNKAAHFIDEGRTAGKIVLGTGGDYTNLDSIVHDLYSLIPVEHRTGREVALIGRELLVWDRAAVYAAFGTTPTEKLALNRLAQQYAGLETVTPAGFPDRGVMVCDPAQLQIYYQAGAVRRALMDNPKRDQVEHYMSDNEAFMIADLDAVAAIDATKVELPGDGE